MRLTWGAMVTFVLILGSFNLQMAIAEYQVDQESEQHTITYIEDKLRRLHDKLTDSFALDKEKAQTHARALGFDSVDELQNAQPDHAIRLPVFYVSLDHLRAYQQGSDPWPLLKQTNTFLYPIVVPGKDPHTIQIRSAALVRIGVDGKGEENHLHLSQLGVNLSVPSRVLREARTSILAKSEHCDYFVISIPALKKRLLGVRREGTCDFTIINIDLSQGLAYALKHVALEPAKDTFQILAEDARSNRYDMPMESRY